MEPVFKGLYDLLEEMHDDCKEEIIGLSQADLDWSPCEGMNSIAILVAHTAGSETFWIGDVVMEQPTGRDRPAEFATKGLDGKALIGLLDGSLSRVEGAFETLSMDQLGESRTSPWQEEGFTLAWAISHILQHTALHLGHIQITRQLLELREE